MSPLIDILTALAGKPSGQGGAAKPGGSPGGAGAFAALLQPSQFAAAKPSGTPTIDPAALLQGQAGPEAARGDLSRLLGPGIEGFVLPRGTTVTLDPSGELEVTPQEIELPHGALQPRPIKPQGPVLPDTDTETSEAAAVIDAALPQAEPPAVEPPPTDTPPQSHPVVPPLPANSEQPRPVRETAPLQAPALKQPTAPAPEAAPGAPVQKPQRYGGSADEVTDGRSAPRSPTPIDRAGVAQPTLPTTADSGSASFQSGRPAQAPNAFAADPKLDETFRSEAGKAAGAAEPDAVPAAGDRKPVIQAPTPIVRNIAINAVTGQTLLTLQERGEGESLPAGIDSSTLPVQTRPASPAAPSIPAAQLPPNGLAVHIAQQFRNGVRRFDIRLDPPELGRVEVRLDVSRDGQVTTHLMVERSETLDLLQRDARNLERALQDAGLNTSDGDLTFSLRDQGLGHDGSDEPEDGLAGTGGLDDGTDTEEGDRLQYRQYNTTGALDIRI